MHDGESIVAVVPARGGSQRIRRKNLRPLAGKSLIAWTLEAALQSGAFDEVLVSTDDEEIAAASRALGASVPWLRPAELATDTATTVDVLRHALQRIEQARGRVAAIVLLQPTSPFRSVADLQGAVRVWREQPHDDRRVLVSVSPAASHPAWCFRIEDGALAPVLGWDIVRTRSQDLPAAYALNGSIYVIPHEILRSNAPLLGPGTRPYVMTAATAAVDIDTEDDWQLAEYYAAKLSSRSPLPGR